MVRVSVERDAKECVVALRDDRTGAALTLKCRPDGLAAIAANLAAASASETRSAFAAATVEDSFSSEFAVRGEATILERKKQ